MKLRISVEGKTYEVDVEVLEDGPTGHAASPGPVHSNPIAPPPVAEKPPAAPQPSASPAPVTGDRVVKAPILGTIVQLKVAAGDTVGVNQVLLVMDAMKMETNVASPLAGRVKAVHVAVGQAVKAGQVLVELE